MKVTDELIDSTYDAMTMMNLASHILSDESLIKATASEMSWMLGSCKQRLEPVIAFLEKLQAHQGKEPSDAPTSVQIPDVLEAIRAEKARRASLNTEGKSNG